MENIERIKAFLEPSYTGRGGGFGDGSKNEGYDYSSGEGYGYGQGWGGRSGQGQGSSGGISEEDILGDGFGIGQASWGAIRDNGIGYSYFLDLWEGIKQINHEIFWIIDYTPTLIDHVHGNYAQGHIMKVDLTTVPCFIARVDNCYAHASTLRRALSEATEKAEESLPTEVVIAKFKDKFPSLQTTATCKELYDWHHRLTGSCTMGRDEFVKAHGLDMDGIYTVEYFLDITADAYGGDIIKLLRKSYN